MGAAGRLGLFFEINEGQHQIFSVSKGKIFLKKGKILVY